MSEMANMAPTPAETAWGPALATALVKGSLPEERRGFDAGARGQAGTFAAGVFVNRKPKQAAFNIESFTAKDGRRLMRVAVANDDMPFLVDSVAAIIASHGLRVTRLLHPVIATTRDEHGLLLALGKGAGTESLIYLECDRGDARVRIAVRTELRDSLAAVRLAVADWSALTASLQDCATQDWAMGASGEDAAFLNWAAEGHFTLLGAETYPAPSEGPGAQRLGIARQVPSVFLSEPACKRALALLRSGAAGLLIVKSNQLSPVHRRVPLDLLITPVLSRGKVTGLRIHAGLWTSAALASPPQDVPILGARLSRLQARYRFSQASHAGKALAHALSALPHDIAVSISETDLEQLALTAMSIADRPRVEVGLVAAPLARHVFGFVWLPRDDLTTDRRVAIATMLTEAAQGQLLNWSIALDEGGVALLRYVIDVRDGGNIPNAEPIKAAIDAMVRGWSSHIESSLRRLVESGYAARLALRYAHHLPQSYRDATPSDDAAADILRLASLSDDQSRSVRIINPPTRSAETLRLKIYALVPLSLSDAVPVLEDFGFHVIEEVATALKSDAVKGNTADDQCLGHIHDFLLTGGGGQTDQAEALEAALVAVLEGRAENDRFNALMVQAGLAARDVLLFRALFRYLRQTGLSYGLLTVVEALRKSPAIARLLVSLFAALHDPARRSEKAAADAVRAIDRALVAVTAIDEDRILRQMRAVIRATLRTNMFAPSGQAALAFKLDSALVPGLPAPLPWREIFVYAPQVEGIHLRAGPIARGGLRWSDRRDDFRTEVLGLMKAQRVKNAVIVPTGAKGGFYPKMGTSGVEAYRLFIRTLLSVTDNLVEGVPVHPNGIVCHDAADPYFVVAADKGTATFSDIANAIAIEQNFWLGDAFASGGSVGYDHKAMGITAKGGWVSVRRHFAERGIDIQKVPVRVAGCGDMSGDVFGNAMLLSKALKLVAAFDHRDIFIDPDPDPALSWKERARLFKLPRSSWADYDARLISKGGGVFSRSAKSIKLSKQARAVLGVDSAEVEPAALIAAILKSPVDLLWFGGIGTYVKAAAENHSTVGDRANDALRVDAEDLRCAVIGEGANLGITQAGRIGFALGGGRINSDFIDNSAGVDCSDNEVNIKIALQTDSASGRLTEAARNRLLVAMTDDVADLVLEDNRLQTLALSIAERSGARGVPAMIRVIETFEAQGRLDRAVEGLASNDMLLRRVGDDKGLTRPEVAVLLATAKLAMQDGIEAARLGFDGATLGDLLAAFPDAMQRKHRAAIESHPLRGEIVATKLANRIVNRMGIVHPVELGEEEGESLGDVAEAFVIAEALYDIPTLWAQIDAASLPESTRLMLFEQVAVELRAHMADILRNSVRGRANDAAIAAYAPSIKRLSDAREQLLPAEARRQTQAFGKRLDQMGAPRKICDQLVRLAELDGAIGLSALAARSKTDIVALTSGFTRLGEALGIDWAQGVAMQLDPQDPWERLLTASLARDFQAMRLEFLARVKGAEPGVAVSGWISAHQDRVSSFMDMVERARRGGMPSPAMLAQIAGQARVLLSRS
jgi:glutamate dehydrogenase